MATVIKEFIYSGTLQIADIPIGVTSLTLHIWGGAGGSGGMDATGPGADAAAGHFVSKTDLDMTAYDGVKSIAVAVGGGGASGTSGQEAEGGKNGQSLTGYSGGKGGKSGSVGTSGSGGGGGGATTITLFESGQSINNIELAIAGGGAGSGGGGTASRGGAGINTNSATGNSPDSLGENGAGHEGDGGGGGAGGGGADGGKGGSGAYGDAGGNSGYSGSNLVPSGGSEDNGSGKTPGGTGNAYYSSGIAVGGAESQAGANGRAVLIFNIPAEAKHKVSGSWKNINEMYTKVSGTWKRLLGGYTKVSGTWKAFFGADILFESNAAGFGNSDGGVTSGTLGTGGIPTIHTIPATAPNLSNHEGIRFIHRPRRKCTWTDYASGTAVEGEPDQKESKTKGIVCTTMYQTTGLEDWKRAMAIWRLYHKKVLGDERGVQAGYHWVFKPYVKGMRRSKVLKFIGGWLARHVTNDMKTKLYKRGIDKTDAPFKHNFRKTDIAGKIILAISEPTLRAVGRVLKMLNMDKGEQ